MNSKQLICTTLEHRSTGRIPVDFGSTGVTGIHVKVVEGIRKQLGLGWKPVKVIEPYQMLGEVDEELIGLLEIDVVGLYGKKNMFGIPNEHWKEFRTWWGQDVLLPGSFNSRTNERGDLYVYPEGDQSVPPSAVMPQGAYFFNAISRKMPFSGKDLDPEDNLQEFTPVSEEDLQWFDDETERLEKTRKGIIASLGGTALGDIALVPGLHLKHPGGIRDVQEWYMATLVHPDYIHRVFDRQTGIAIKNLEKIHQRIGNRIDAVFTCGTDFGTQAGQFCSVDTFRQLDLPYYKKVNDWIHRNTGWQVFKHSCGAIAPLMESLIDAGFDIINPAQINAEGMDPQFLKKEFGNRIIFWGGGVDTQRVLPFGTPGQVKRQVMENCRIFGKDGGFVFNTIHNIQANVPVENVMAMLQALKAINSNG